MIKIMKAKANYFVLAIACLVLISFNVQGQATYQLAPQPELKITGTSTLHDWEMISKEATGEAVLQVQEGKLQGVQKLTVLMPAESIKSGKGAMDKNAYAALDTKKHKDIRFVLSSMTAAGPNRWKVKGDFTIAGVTQPVTFDVKSSQSGADYSIQGKYAFQLTDFKINPPTALMGTVKTGNEVAIHFNITLKPSK